MIGIDYFDEPAEAQLVLDRIEDLVREVVGRPARLRLVTELDPGTRDRVLQLRDQVFSRGSEVFDRKALAEVASDPEALFVVLEIDGSIEAYCFGYYQEPGQEMVAGADFFMDTAACAAKWQSQGIAHVVGAGVLLLVHLFGDVRQVGISVWNGDRVDDLIGLYRQFGFVEAESPGSPYRCMTVTMDDEQADRWRASLGVPGRARRP